MAGHGIEGVSPLTELSPVERLRAIALQVDTATVKRTIELHYGFTPSDQYCRDFVAFVEAVTHEPRS